MRCQWHPPKGMGGGENEVHGGSCCLQNRRAVEKAIKCEIAVRVALIFRQGIRDIYRARRKGAFT